MKKKILALVCAAALTLSLLVVPSSASNSLFFLSLNDTLAPQSVQTTPIQHSGWVYVPVTAFNNRVTGINFGVYYGFTDNNESLIFYNLCRLPVFRPELFLLHHGLWSFPAHQGRQRRSQRLPVYQFRVFHDAQPV